MSTFSIIIWWPVLVMLWRPLFLLSMANCLWWWVSHFRSQRSSPLKSHLHFMKLFIFIFILEVCSSWFICTHFSAMKRQTFLRQNLVSLIFALFLVDAWLLIIFHLFTYIIYYIFLLFNFHNRILYILIYSKTKLFKNSMS